MNSNQLTKQLINRYKYNQNNSYNNYNKFRKFRDFLNYLKLKKQFQRKRLKSKLFHINSINYINNRFKLNNSKKRLKLSSVKTRFQLIKTQTIGPKMKRNGVENCPNNGMPVCQYYLEGRCNSDSCPYRHINVGSDAQICRHFNRGFCPNGDQVFRYRLLTDGHNPVVEVMVNQTIIR